MATFHPLSRCTTPVEAYFNETSLGVSTGFFYKQNGQHYLVTNWHVLTGRDPVTGKHISKNAGEPNRIKIWHHRTDGNRQVGFLPLEDNCTNLWLQHDQYGSKTDVVALPLEPDDRFQFFPIDELEDRPPQEFGPFVGKEVFVLGYPFGKLATKLSVFPIWKRASIATELGFMVEDLPCLLIDTATRKGMSGSPVVYVMGEFLQFMGVYSGRFGADDLDEIQLGRVWRDSVLRDVVATGVPGSREPSK